MKSVIEAAKITAGVLLLSSAMFMTGVSKANAFELSDALGPVVGAMVGSQVGNGSGQVAATIGGAIIGRAVAQQRMPTISETAGGVVGGIAGHTLSNGDRTWTGAASAIGVGAGGYLGDKPGAGRGRGGNAQDNGSGPGAYRGDAYQAPLPGEGGQAISLRAAQRDVSRAYDSARNARTAAERAYSNGSDGQVQDADARFSGAIQHYQDVSARARNLGINTQNSDSQVQRMRTTPYGQWSGASAEKFVVPAGYAGTGPTRSLV